MADLEKLVVQMSADLRSWENAMAKAQGISRAQLKQLKADATGTGNAAEAAFAGASRGVRNYGSSAAIAAKQAGSLRAQTGNLAAQFQDIAVQLQMGQSPFQIALQQGTQISAVLGGQGAMGAVRALGGAFASLISPVSLATIAIIAAGGVAVQYFSSLLGDGEKSAEELKKQADLIRQVAKDWGDAVPAVRAYADAVERASQAANLRESGQILRAEAYGTAREQVESLANALVVLRSDLELLSGPEDVAKLSALQSAFNDLQAKVEGNTATAEDAERVQDALNQVMALGAPTADGFAASLGVLAGALGSAADEAARAESQINGALNAMRTFRAADAESMRQLGVADASGEAAIARIKEENALTKDQIALKRETARIAKEIADAGGIADPATAEQLARDRLAAEDRRNQEGRTTGGGGGGGGGRSSATSDADREREAVTKLIEALRFEQSLVGLTNEEKAVQNALRRAGSAATAEERAQIEQIVTATYAQTEAIRQNEEAMERLKGLSRDVLSGMFEDLRDGAGAAEVLSNALNRVAESLVNAGIDNLINSVFGGGGLGGRGIFGGAIIPGILHSGGVAGRDGYGHGRAVSPAVFAGAPRYHNGGIAGLRAGEVPAILQKGEIVIPKGGRAQQQGGGNVINFSPVIDARGADSAAVARLEVQLRAQGEEFRRTFRARVAESAADPRNRSAF